MSPSYLSIINLGALDAGNFEILTIDNLSENDWRKPLVDYLRHPTGSNDRKVKYLTLIYVLLEVELFKKTAEGVLLKRLGESETYIVVSNMHSGACGSHQVGYKIKWLLVRLGVYWPSMLKDCIEFSKGFQ